MKVIGVILLVLLGLVFWPSEKDQLDKQMAELCKKDGGVKIYETVKLSPEMFDESGYPFPGWRKRLHSGNRLGNEYQYIREEIVIKDGDPFVYKGKGRLSKWHTKIMRKIDQKILGEAVGYYRVGGDIWATHPSASICPKNGSGPIEKLVFIKNLEGK